MAMTPESLTQEQAEAIRLRFYSTDGWADLASGFPRAAEAIAALPDESLLVRCNVMFREMYADARELAVYGTGALAVKETHHETN